MEASQRKIITLEAEVESWKAYSERLEEWFYKYRDNLSSMEAAMSKPNKPGYYRANND
jgi:hypothetical protein